jgi:hypothetical protein
VEGELAAACITVVRGVPAVELIRRLGGDPSTAVERDLAGCYGLARDPFDLVATAQFWDERDAGIVVEPNGFAAADDVVASRLSVGGLLVTAYWSVNLDMRLLVGIDGAVVRDLDPVFGEATASLASSPPLPEEADLHLGAEQTDPIQASLTLSERLTGVCFDRATLGARPRPTVVLPTLRSS